ncbi:MAG: hypothetical protein ISS61_02100 [Desulfobacteraceae bacterium]|nr:hypothetical protein [Desulfobacteraceae bacterium]
MNTPKHNALLDAALSSIQKKFRTKIITAYFDLKRNCIEARHDAAGLAAGKFCEAVLRHIQKVVTGSSIPFNKKIGNFADECRKLIVSPSGASTESERVILPRALVFLYTMRNKRGIGHIGGDVDANEIDTAVMARTADWVLCELVRIHHGMSLEEAQDLVDSISVRQLPAIWEVAGKKRVLKKGLSAGDQVLLILYSSKESALLVEDLCDWIEYSNLSVFKSRVLKTLHKKRMIEFDKETDSVLLSPTGAQRVEEHIL